MDIAPMLTELVALEQQVSDAAKTANARDELRVYEWRPSRLPELPAIWNWINDDESPIIDTARQDDVIVIKATIGVLPADLAESMGQLTRLTDHFRHVVDPALWRNQGNEPLNATARSARRTLTFTEQDEFDGTPVMCMSMLITVQLPHIIVP